uniref:Uncharacterized protein n=1 Tax=Cyanoptyche gloeocystis TaxID=77922 RepID=A0A7S2JNL3_9EUKA|mmetsp:Transcript_64/g.140  ORF Transcript_64/g.140 Transcript_64/m.140 type:complete len:295 (+) Transcript_64:28-912(+)|eukprot:CAMPEP_0196654696 /NCGR_PEP_ID=MMETSP1086-20130531/4420_1 /TAXON_ID=77921 /ORGANISM="Cyanoptyche  gloeocystis , Strain SAG4.97" /LENGTH=294 /DNA_ID=CAMNT_0041986601 /DNA_START=26 /DNA_END=910 /DNA_ORIENTATION=-
MGVDERWSALPAAAKPRAEDGWSSRRRGSRDDSRESENWEPSNAMERRKLSLAPRTLPVDRDVTSPKGDARPRLNLVSRKNSQDSSETAQSSSPSSPQRSPRSPVSTKDPIRKTNPFGNAKPREEILKERGAEDPEQRIENELLRTNKGTHHESISPTNRPPSGSGSQESRNSRDDGWRTVEKGRAIPDRDEYSRQTAQDRRTPPSYAPRASDYYGGPSLGSSSHPHARGSHAFPQSPTHRPSEGGHGFYGHHGDARHAGGFDHQYVHTYEPTPQWGLLDAHPGKRGLPLRQDD